MLTRQKGNWGLGVQLRGEGAAFNFGHGGSNAGFKCALVMLLESGNGAVVMTNGDQGGKLATELIREIANEHHWAAGWDADGR
ncbi:MAG TPA: hypothetical protein VM120_03615 [Bryobacteraceae bacterium]|nr:hypothetical protein [Bryobacteraceae bacterium]